MTCHNCNQDSDNGTVSGGRFICRKCEAMGLVSRLEQDKSHKPDWRIIDALKAYYVPGNVAARYAEQKRTEYLVRYIWFFRYRLQNGGIKNKFAFVRHAIHHGYALPDAFFDWMKQQRANPPQNIKQWEGVLYE